MIKEYIEYLKKNPEKYWFKRKLYGWGWTPATWQGWTVLLVFVALLVLNALRLKIGGETPYEIGLTFMLETFVLVLALIAICYKTGESPKWMWGLPKEGVIKKCDHTSVGVFVWDKDRLLLIERLKGSKGFALPAGHVDGDNSYEEAARRELKEEVNLVVSTLTLVHEERKENPCRREGGSWHYWKLYKASVSGDVIASKEETRGFCWCTQAELEKLGAKTEAYLRHEITEEAWANEPGLEVVMYQLFKTVNII